MAHPRFPYPMYEPLHRYDREWMVPGLGLIKRPDMATLLRDQQPVHRGLPGRAQPRDGARAALARVPDRPARHLLLLVLDRRARARRRHARAAVAHRRAAAATSTRRSTASSCSSSAATSIRRYPGRRRARGARGRTRPSDGIPLFAAGLAGRDAVPRPPAAERAAGRLRASTRGADRHARRDVVVHAVGEPDRAALRPRSVARRARCSRDNLIWDDFGVDAPGEFLDATAAHGPRRSTGCDAWGAIQRAGRLPAVPAARAGGVPRHEDGRGSDAADGRPRAHPRRRSPRRRAERERARRGSSPTSTAELAAERAAACAALQAGGEPRRRSRPPRAHPRAGRARARASARAIAELARARRGSSSTSCSARASSSRATSRSCCCRCGSRCARPPTGARCGCGSSTTRVHAETLDEGLSDAERAAGIALLERGLGRAATRRRRGRRWSPPSAPRRAPWVAEALRPTNLAARPGGAPEFPDTPPRSGPPGRRAHAARPLLRARRAGRRRAASPVHGSAIPDELPVGLTDRDELTRARRSTTRTCRRSTSRCAGSSTTRRPSASGWRSPCRCPLPGPGRPPAARLRRARGARPARGRRAARAPGPLAPLHRRRRVRRRRARRPTTPSRRARSGAGARRPGRPTSTPPPRSPSGANAAVTAARARARPGAAGDAARAPATPSRRAPRRSTPRCGRRPGATRSST